MYLYIHIYTPIKTKIGPHYGCMPIFLGQKKQSRILLIPFLLVIKPPLLVIKSPIYH